MMAATAAVDLGILGDQQMAPHALERATGGVFRTLAELATAEGATVDWGTFRLQVHTPAVVAGQVLVLETDDGTPIPPAAMLRATVEVDR